MLYLCPNTHTHTCFRHTYAITHTHTSVSACFSGCAPAPSGSGRVLSMRTPQHLLICGRTSGVCLPPSLTLWTPCLLRHHAPKAAAAECKSAWPLSGPLSWSSGLETCCQVSKGADLNDAMKLVDNVIRRYNTITSPPIKAVRACHFVKSSKLSFRRPTKLRQHWGGANRWKSCSCLCQRFLSDSGAGRHTLRQ